jgi:serine/threonine protein kinase
VYEVDAFVPDEVLSAGVTRNEDASRHFMTQHVLRQCDDNNHDTNTPRKRQRPVIDQLTRYAVKHLRHNLTSDPERFERAAVDLVLEGQLLMAMDHPNIIGIRGWSYAGPDAYRSGKYADYFLILDCLNETLDRRVESWRRSLRKYRSRVSFPWSRKKYEPKLQRVLRERLETAHDIACAIEYMHDRRIINRDIKSANIGFDIHGDVKVFDFGLSRLLPDTSDEHGNYQFSRVGTKAYMAPEVRNKLAYNLSVDVYSYGVVLWELMALATPTHTMIMTRKSIEASPDKSGCWLPICPCWPAAIQTLIRSSVAFDPAERPCMENVRAVLMDELSRLGGTALHRPHRRRSTFRVDLSAQLCEESKTSHTSSAFESEELQHEELQREEV